MDRVKVLDKHGLTRYIIEGERVIDVRACDHKLQGGLCQYCGLVAEEIKRIKERYEPSQQPADL